MNQLWLFEARPMPPAPRMRYPSEPGSRKSDTSAQAAKAIRRKAHKWDQQILDALSDYGPMTFWEIASVTGIAFDNAQPAVSRMRAAGKVTDSGLRKPNPKGRLATLWRLP